MTRILVLISTTLHWLLVIYALIGWAWPAGEMWRWIYAIYIPSIMLQWWFNKGVCIINNIENLILYGKWRNPSENPAEGAFVLSNIERLTGLKVSYLAYNVVLHILLTVLWIVNLDALMALGSFSGIFGL